MELSLPKTPMLSLRRLRHSKAGRNFGASILAFVSSSAFGLLSIPVAVHYMSKEELGLWAAVNTVVAYLMWMDLGVGSATGRKIADAVVAEDPKQINVWWTATQMALWSLGGITFLIGICITPAFPYLFNVPAHLSQDAWILLLGTLLCSAVNFPLRGVPGLLTAQERFHWVPICQSVAPWIQLGVFFFMLRAGYGLQSYVFGAAAAQIFSFIYYRVLISTSKIRPRYDREGISRSHFKELFGFSLNLAVIGFKDTFLSTLPVIILARTAGLQAVPVYTISGRSAGLVRSLSMRVNHAFLPELINLHVAGKHETFLMKYRRSLLLATAVGLAGASAVLLVNRSIVTLLAGPEFYAGDMVTAWFSLMLVVATISSVYQVLLQISGNMGKSIPFAIANVVIVLFSAPVAFRFFGMAGLAAVFAMQPILYGIYGLLRGARNCGYAMKEFINLGMAAAIVSIASVIVIGCFMDSSHPLGHSFLLFGKSVLLPSLSQMICSGLLMGISGICAWLGTRRSKPAAT
jgi:O-antigen/teichoic acid export membrane protein